MRKRRFLVVGPVVALVACGGMASAYWVVGSVGSGEAAGTVAIPDKQHIKVALTSNLTNLYPGKEVVLAGNFDNPTMPVTAHSVTVTVASVSRSGCRVSDFVLSKPTTLVDAVVPVGHGVGHWGGDLSLTFRNNPHKDQSACHGAEVNLKLTSN